MLRLERVSAPFFELRAPQGVVCDPAVIRACRYGIERVGGTPLRPSPRRARERGW